MRSKLVGKKAIGIFSGILFLFLLCWFKSGNLVSTRVPAALVTLVHRKDLYYTIDLIRNVEDRFNHKYKYDWVFLSEEDIADSFKEVVGSFVSGNAHFRPINRKNDWAIPADINRNQLMTNMQELDMNGVPEGGSTTFRLRSKFLSRPIVDYLPEYRYFIHIGNNIKLYCDMPDIFADMKSNGAKLAYTISSSGTPHATNGLTDLVSDFMRNNKDIVRKDHWIDSFVEPGKTFCEFAPGFIAWDLDFLRSDSFNRWYKDVDESSGIFYNRWSETSIQTLAAALFLSPREVQFLGDVGIYDGGRVNCPTDHSTRLSNKCTCPFDPRIDRNERNKIFTYSESSCTPKFLSLKGESFQPGWDKYSDASVANAYKTED